MLRSFLVLMLFPVLAVAQDKVAKRTCRILFLNPPPDAPKKLYLFDGTSSQEVEAPGMNFSDVYKVAGGNTTLRLLSAPVLTAEEIPSGAPGGKLAESVSDFYIVATGDPSNKVVPVRIQIIDAGSERFRKGQMMWYNLTSKPVGGQLGSRKLAMDAQSRVIVDSPAKDNEPFDVNLAYAISGDPQLHPICQTKWTHDPRSRMVVFVYGGADNTAPQISGFKDFRDEPVKPD